MKDSLADWFADRHGDREPTLGELHPGAFRLMPAIIAAMVLAVVSLSFPEARIVAGLLLALASLMSFYTAYHWFQMQRSSLIFWCVPPVLFGLLAYSVVFIPGAFSS